MDGEVDPTANIKQAPWMASLGKWLKGSYTQWIHQCAGSLITQSHVLTSAHCFSQIVEIKCVTESDCDYVGGYESRTEFLRYINQ